MGTMDNVIRPILIRMGADLPLILILSGVIGVNCLRHDWPVHRSGSASGDGVSSPRVHEVPPPGTDPDVILSELEELEDKNAQ